ncbi:unnamed protein product, partial [Phaeothamnion confervicola]
TYKLPNGTCTSPLVPHTSYEYDTLLNSDGTSSPMTGLAVTTFANSTWSGQPTNVATGLGPNYTTLSNDWTTSGPPEAVNTSGTQLVDGFSLSLTGEIIFPAVGTWTMTVTGDDSASLYIDDTLIATSAGSAVSGSYVIPVGTTLTHRIRVTHSEVSGNAKLAAQWSGPGVSTQAIPTSALRPRYSLQTRATVDDSSADAPAQVSHTEYSATGIDPALGLATRVTVDPRNTRLTTTTTFETAGLRRRTARTLPGGNQTTYDYYSSGASASVDVPCTAANDTTVNQGQRLRKATDPTGANGNAVISESVYDVWGRVVATRAGYRNSGVDNWDASWTCTAFDDRGRTTSVAIPARGAQPARTVYTDYSVSGNPLVIQTCDNANGVVTINSDLLGRAVQSVDVWSKTTTSTFDQTTGRLTSTSGPEGAQGFSYDRAGKITQQSLDGNVVAVPSYLAAGNANEFQLGSVGYPSGVGNTGNGTSGTLSYNTNGQVVGLAWTQSNSSPLTSNTVTRAQSGRILDDAIDGTDAFSGGNNYRYDTAGRLVTARMSGGIVYQYNYVASGRC